MNTQDILTEHRTAAIVLILSFVVFLGAGTLFTGRNFWGWPLGENSRYLTLERILVVAAFLVSLMGFALLEGLLREAGDRAISRPALAIYLVSATLMAVAETSFMANREFVTPQIIAHVMLAFLAQAAFGVALLSTGLVAGWAGWVMIVWNLGWMVALPFVSPRDLYYPVLHHVAPLVLGIAMLIKG